MADRSKINDLRIERELDNIENDQSLVGVTFRRYENNTRHLTATMMGPVSTPYEGGIFKIDINLPDTYPFAPPRVRFITKIWHPNIGSQSGAVRMGILNEGWTPVMNLNTTMIALQALLSTPEANEPLEESVARHYSRARDSFVVNARDWTEKYATATDTPPELTTRTSGRVTKIPTRFSHFLL